MTRRLTCAARAFSSPSSGSPSSATRTGGSIRSRSSREGLDWLAKAYEGKTTLVPETLAYADIALVCALTWLRFRKVVDIDAWPALARMETAHEARPSFVATYPYPR